MDALSPNPYTLLRTSLALFKKPPRDLSEEQLQQAQHQASHEFSLESKILNTPEASGVIISDHELQAAYQEIRSRYDDETTFLSDLDQNQLDQDSLNAALFRQCRVNVVMDIIGSRSPNISEIEIGIYYHLHKDQFNRPEQREVCHIFISINPDYPENTRAIAYARLHEIHAKLVKKPHKFADLALAHSECPTALQGGTLGTVPRGKLYPELDSALFALKVGGISDIVETEIGFHIVLCKHIHSAHTLSLAKATPAIRQLMQDRARRTCQRAWLAALAKSS